MELRLLLIRHGETIWNRENKSQGFSDIPLNGRGERQAVALARSLEGERLEAVYCSDLVRARRTAETIAERHKLMVRPDARLRELNQGALEGTSLKDLLKDYPELLEKWMSEPADVTMPGGESMRALQTRAMGAVRDIRESFPEGKVCVVSHNLCIKSIVCSAIGLDLNNFQRLRLDTAAASEVGFGDRGPFLVKINDTSLAAGRRGPI